MKLLIAPTGKRLVWYLAMEEYLAANVQEDTLFLWIVEPTVIFGRHQVMENEVNVPYCEANGIRMYRRKSGGGCVYADEGNLMVSYISPSPHSEQVFAHYMEFMSDALRKMGYPAVTTEHNDILVDGKKVSGTACFALPQSTIVHATLLWQVNFDRLQQAITPPKEKLAKHGVESVRQRVVNLSAVPQNADLQRTPAVGSMSDLVSTLTALLADSTDTLPEEAHQAIDAIERTYLDPAFLHPAP
ncbi:MAG: lipoate--protein ligase family protein [Paludibacteraceae bacterium]|nr:lipoate--protein ligase family protein [Paludibacteraceae bacterium]